MPVLHGFIEKLAELSATGTPFVSVTMVDAVGSTPQDVGTKMLVDHGGLAFGTVGGGRIENKAIEFARDMLASCECAPTALVEWNLQHAVGMTCGGVVKLFFEVYNHHVWRMVIFGAGHVAQALVRVLLQMECRVTCVDPRSEWLNKLPESAEVERVQLESPQDYVGQLRDGDFVLCMTMGHRTDRPVLEAIFHRRLQLPYLGAIGSMAKRKVLVRELIGAGIPAEVADSFRCPIGLKLGTNQPGEIAVSIAAELIQTRDALSTTTPASSSMAGQCQTTPPGAAAT